MVMRSAAHNLSRYCNCVGTSNVPGERCVVVVVLATPTDSAFEVGRDKKGEDCSFSPLSFMPSGLVCCHQMGIIS